MSIKKKLSTILASEAFEELIQYSQPNAWDDLSLHERELLSTLFIKHGEKLILKDEKEALKNFKIATKISPESPTIILMQARVFIESDLELKHIANAKKCIEQVLPLENPSQSVAHEIAVLCILIGKQSKKQTDLKLAIERFHIAEKTGIHTHEFHDDFGMAYLEYYKISESKQTLFYAIEHFKKATTILTESPIGLLHLGMAYRRLHELDDRQEDFEEANICFSKAAIQISNNGILWAEWGHLLFQQGLNTVNFQYIETCCKYFEKADILKAPDFHATSYLSWGEAEFTLAVHKEDFDMLHRASEKLSLAVKTHWSDPESWCLYGECLTELGRYFDDIGYYMRAITAFEDGLYCESDHIHLLHGIASAYTEMAELQKDASLFLKAVEHYTLIEESLEGSNEENPNRSEILADWGTTLLKWGELTGEKIHIENAIDKFVQALDGKVDSLPEQQPELEWLYHYGCAIDSLGEITQETVYYEAAVKALSHVLNCDSSQINVMYHLALARLHLGAANADVECLYTALQHFETLIKHDCEDDEARNGCGLTLINIGILYHDPILNQNDLLMFESAEQQFQYAVALGNTDAFYNLACVQALKKNCQLAMYYLEKAEMYNTLPPIVDVMHDEWLSNIHEEPSFRQFLSQLIHKHIDSN